MSAHTILTEVTGDPQKIIDARTNAASQIYSDQNQGLGDDVFAELDKIGNRDLYIVSRDDWSRKNLLNDSHFCKVFSNNSLSLFKYIIQ